MEFLLLIVRTQLITLLLPCQIHSMFIHIPRLEWSDLRLQTAFADTFGTEMSASSGVTLMKREAPVGTAAQTYRMSSEDVSFWPKFDDSE